MKLFDFSSFNIIKLLNINFFLNIFISLFVFGFFIEGFTKIKYIGLIGAVLFFLIYIFKNKDTFNFKIKINTYLLLFFIFILYLFINIFFAFGDIYPSLHEFKVQFLNIGIIFFILLTFKEVEIKYIYYTLIIAFIYNVIIYFYNYYQINKELNFSIRLTRNFSDYFDILFPFFVVFIFLLKNIFIKMFFIIIVLFGLFELILTGARGAWGTILIEMFLISVFIIYLNKKFLKKLLLFFILFISLIVSSGIYLYKNSSLIQMKIKQGLSPNGRNYIIRDRLPIFIHHFNIIHGVGGIKNYQYNKFLNYYKAPIRFAVVKKNMVHYYSDEPFLLHLFYTNGVIGIFLFVMLSLYLIKEYLCVIKKRTYNSYFAIAGLTSFIGVYFIRGLVEGRDFKFLVFCVILLYLLKLEGKYENSYTLS